MPEEQIYTVIIGDISGSKQLNGMDRYQTQLFVKSAIVQINEEYQSFIEAPMTITKGDEFQGLIDSPGHAYQIIQALEKMVFPIHVRYGLGVGQIYRMGGTLPIEMDGPAFHKANGALTQAKKRKISACFISEIESYDKLINTVLSLVSAIKSRWNDRHYKLYWDYLELGTYKRVAEQQNVTPQAICDVLKNSRATDIISAEKHLIEVLNNFQPEPHFQV